MLVVACFLLCLNHEPKFLGTWFVKLLWSLVLSVFLFLLPRSWPPYQAGICWNENVSLDYFVYLGNVKSASSVGLWLGILREDFYCVLFFSFYIQSQGQDKQMFLVFLSVKLFSFLTHWEFCFLGRPGFMEESQIDFYLASAPKLCLQFIKLQWCCDWHGTEVLGFGNYNFFYSGIPGFLVILVM